MRFSRQWLEARDPELVGQLDRALVTAVREGWGALPAPPDVDVLAWGRAAWRHWIAENPWTPLVQLHEADDAQLREAASIVGCGVRKS